MIMSLERSLSVQIAFGVEDADVAGVQPAAAQASAALASGLLPIARHHDVAAAEDFAGLARRQRRGPRASATITSTQA